MKILMVLTSHDQLSNTGRKTDFWLEEFAAPYFVFRNGGADLTLASRKGGQPPIDPKSNLPENQTPAMARFKKNERAKKELSQTVGERPKLFGEALDFDSIKSTLTFGEYDAVLVDAMMRWLRPRLSQIGLLCTS